MSNDKPDDRERAIRHYAASIVGEYVAGQVRRDFIAGADWGHARALKEMGAEVTRLSGHVRDLVGDVKNLTTVLNLTTDDRTRLRQQLAAAELKAGELIAAGDALVRADPLDWPRAYCQWQRAAHRRGGEGG